ncbi:polyprenyl synthetase family protein [Halanaerocella petrolearia]
MFWNQFPVINSELQKFEDYFQEQLISAQPLIQESISELAKAGGKRIRPALIIAVAQNGDYNKREVWPVAAAIEMLHMSTLIHDDIIDEANFRRGRKTVQQSHGKDVAVFTGDYLFSLTFDLLSETASKRHTGLIAKLIKKICEGEIQQYQDRYKLDISCKDYLHRIKKKTALLFETCCLLGSELGSLLPRNRQNLIQYGRYLGMAFQLTDDVLDFTKLASKLGKPTNNDFTQGIYTLPILFVLNRTEYNTRLKKLLQKPVQNKVEIKRVINKTNALDYTVTLAKSYLQKAESRLEQLSAISNRDLLFWLADQVLERRF